jgi:hypothetical protein
VGEAVREHIGPYVATLPQPQRAFDFNYATLTNEVAYNIIQERKNVVILAPLGDSTRVARFLRQRLSPEARQAIEGGEVAVVRRDDLWRRDQVVYYLTAATDTALVAALEDNGPRIRDAFEDLALTRMEAEMFEKGRQFDVEEVLVDRHDVSVKVQHDYQIAIDTTTDSTGFVWMRRMAGGSKGQSRRELMIWYKENADPSVLRPEWIHATRDSLTERYMRGNVGGYAQIDYRRPLQTEETDFEGRYGFETRGLWHMIGEGEDGEMLQYGGGGPFVNYSFYDQETGRLYMIDGSVFAPGYNQKRQFLRQLEVIAHTFRTRAEMPPPDEAIARN